MHLDLLGVFSSSDDSGNSEFIGTGNTIKQLKFFWLWVSGHVLHKNERCRFQGEVLESLATKLYFS